MTAGDKPAFPILVGLHDHVNRGMTLRQWYAGQALAGLCSDIHGLSADMQRSGVRCTLDEKVGDLAVMMADATLKALGP